MMNFYVCNIASQHRMPGTHTIRLRSVGRLGGSNSMSDRTGLRVGSFFSLVERNGEIVSMTVNKSVNGAIGEHLALAELLKRGLET